MAGKVFCSPFCIFLCTSGC